MQMHNLQIIKYYSPKRDFKSSNAWRIASESLSELVSGQERLLWMLKFTAEEQVRERGEKK